MRSSLIHQVSSRNTSRHVSRNVHVVVVGAASSSSSSSSIESSWNTAGKAVVASAENTSTTTFSNNSKINNSYTRRLFSSQQTGTVVAKSSLENNQIATQEHDNNQVTTQQNIRPIDFDVQSKVEGNESQIVTVTLEPNQILRAESGAMMYMTDGVEMNTTTGGGMSSGFQRMMTGQNFFISDYSYKGEVGTSGTVALGTDFPSKILRLNVQEYGVGDQQGKLVCQKGALLCAAHTVNIQMEFSKSFAAGFFGGEGFVLQGLTGEGDVFIKAGGTVIRRYLREAEQLRISSGCLVAFSGGVDYDVQMIKGFANVFAGGEGLFMTTLTGPGTVWLQGQPPQRMISEIARRIPSGGGLGLAIPIGGGGGGGGSGGGGGGDGGTTGPTGQ